jgi:hypothetical protein
VVLAWAEAADNVVDEVFVVDRGTEAAESPSLVLAN